VDASSVEPGASAESVEAPVAPLSASIVFLGGADIVPRGISVLLSRSTFSPAEIGAPPTRFALTVEPALAGTFTVVSESALEWVPTSPMLPGETYTATFEQLDGQAAPWVMAATTPAFQFRRASLRRLAPPGAPVSVDLVFSAPPVLDTVRDAVHVRLGDAEARVTLEVAQDPNAVTLVIRRPEGSASARMDISLDGGVVAWAGNPRVKAAAGEGSVSLADGPRVTIRDVHLQEGTDGWYFEVVCDDNAAPGERGYRYLRQVGEGYELSTRCEVDDTYASNTIHVDTGSKLSLSPGLGGFRVFSSELPRGPVKVTIDAGTTTIDGGFLAETFEKEFDIPARTSAVSFVGQGRYLPRTAWKNLGVRHLNVSALDVEVRHVPAENLVFWMTGEEPTTERTSNRVAATSIAVQDPTDAEVTSYVSVASLVPDPAPGLYEINLKGTVGKVSARILLTDLHLVAKATARPDDASQIDDIRVWALDVHDGAAQDDVVVRAVRASGQSIAECETDDTDGCLLQIPRDDVDGRPPVALIAQRGDDLTYVAFDDLRLDLPSDAGGVPYTTVVPYQAPLWMDRGVYRPGETAHVAAMVRDASFVAPAAGLPVLVRVFDPKERETRKRVVATDAAGVITADFGFGDYAATGRYRVTAEVGGQPVGETTFQIEEFVPERLKVTAAAVAAGHLPDAPMDVAVTGEWLFGGPASGARVEGICTLEPSTFAPAGFDGWSFGPAYLTVLPSAVSLGTVNGQLDDDGKATLTCPATTAGISGPTSLVVQASVFEGESGRTTVATARSPVHPEKYWIGLDSSAPKAHRGQVIPFQGVVVDWTGKATAAVQEVTVDVFRMEEEYGWWYDEDEGDSSQRRTLRPAREDSQRVAVTDGKFTVQVTPKADAAGLMVRVRAGHTVTERFVEGTGGRYWWGDEEGRTVDTTPRPLRPASLPIEVPGPVQVGVRTTASVHAPYPGRILWTLETDRVVQAVWLDATSGRNEWPFQVDQFVPNVYVSAFLVKDPHLESAEAFLPDRAFGVESVVVAPTKYVRALTLEAPDEVRPYSSLTVQLTLAGVTGPATATVAAVDEGVLSLTRFETPDPLAKLFEQRALGVRSFETIGWTRMGEAAGSSSTTGGDEEEGSGNAGSRVQMVKPVAMWSGPVSLDANGHASVTFQVPGYRGKLRVMAVAVTPDGVGRADQQVTVRDPLVLQTTLPRFLLTGDEAHIPVQVTNTTRAAKDVLVKVEATELQVGAVPDVDDGLPSLPVLAFVGPAEGTLHLEPGEAGTAVFRVRARSVPGAAHLLVTATSGNFRSKEELDLPIQVARTAVREVKQLLVQGTASVDLLPLYQGFAEGSDVSTVWLTANPYADSLTHLRYLVRYPFG
jgi:uncharacterized protein YfaS (alpha-2-macroglobulin family)